MATAEDASTRTGIEPGYGWFGDEYKAVWRVFIDGRQVGCWTKPRWARRDLREQLRDARRAAERAGPPEDGKG